MKRRNRPVELQEQTREVASAPAEPQFQQFPAAQNAGPLYRMPNTGVFPVQANGMPMGLPQYTSYDEYGRAYTPIMTYGPQPHSAPVPVPIPSTVVQMTPIISPVAFVPYATQNESLYQWDQIDE